MPKALSHAKRALLYTLYFKGLHGVHYLTGI